LFKIYQGITASIVLPLEPQEDLCVDLELHRIDKEKLNALIGIFNNMQKNLHSILFVDKSENIREILSLFSGNETFTILKPNNQQFSTKKSKIRWEKFDPTRYFQQVLNFYKYLFA
jgi:hypothetical protein